MVDQGIQEDRIIVTGTTLFNHLIPREAHEGVNVVLSPLHWENDLDSYKEEQQVQEVQFAKTMDFPTLTKRPLYSVLNCPNYFEAFGLGLQQWNENLM